MLYDSVRRAPLPCTEALTWAGGGSDASLSVLIAGEPGSGSIVYVPATGLTSPTTVMLCCVDRMIRTARLSVKPDAAGLSRTLPSGVRTRTASDRPRRRRVA